jgi:CubicO group peptidase (beta-lactamase class C family)
VCACTGIPRYDMKLLFSFAGVQPEQLIGDLALLKPTTAFGETFQYNNQMVAMGGYLAARAFYPKLPFGEAYDKAMKEKVLTPLGMTASTLSIREGRARAAATHGADNKGEIRVMPFSYEEFVIPLRPSGGLLSNAEDMAKYLLAELAEGKAVTGAQVASPENVVMRRKPQVKISDELGYGMGLVSGTRKGVPIVEHGGATFGHRSSFLYFPTQGVGIAVLANAPRPLGSLIEARLGELLFGGKEEAEKNLQETVADEKRDYTRMQETLAPSESKEVISALLGTYHSADLGDATLKLKGTDLWFDAGEWQSRVGWKKAEGKPSELVLLDPPVAWLPFERREDKGKTTLVLTFGQHTYTFARK